MFKSVLSRKISSSIVPALKNARVVAAAPVFRPSRIGIRQFSQLKQVLKTELETSTKIPNELAENFSNYIKESNFEIVSQPGKSLVELVKNNGNQSISVFFDIDEITDIPISEELIEDDFEEDIDNYLSSIKVLVTKSDNTSVFFNLFYQGESFMIDFVNYSNNPEILTNLRNGEFIDKLNYQGPRFSELDESLQVGFENWLNDLGINNELGEFIYAFSEIKEEEEYRKWLNDLTNFF